MAPEKYNTSTVTEPKENDDITGSLSELIPYALFALVGAIVLGIVVYIVKCLLDFKRKKIAQHVVGNISLSDISPEGFTGLRSINSSTPRSKVQSNLASFSDAVSVNTPNAETIASVHSIREGSVAPCLLYSSKSSSSNNTSTCSEATQTDPVTAASVSQTFLTGGGCDVNSAAVLLGRTEWIDSWFTVEDTIHVYIKSDQPENDFKKKIHNMTGHPVDKIVIKSSSYTEM